jgi:hypothetical protein
MILRVGLNMFWIRITKSTSVPTVIPSRSTSHTPSHTIAEMVTASSTPTTQLNRASRPTASSAACIAFVL